MTIQTDIRTRTGVTVHCHTAPARSEWPGLRVGHFEMANPADPEGINPVIASLVRRSYRRLRRHGFTADNARKVIADLLLAAAWGNVKQGI